MIDVACGQGIAARLAASLGATVVGTDASPAMIANAERHATPEGPAIRYVVADAHRLDPFGSTYLNALTRAGFEMEECREPAADALLARQQPLYAEVPIFFAARVRRRAQG